MKTEATAPACPGYRSVKELAKDAKRYRWLIEQSPLIMMAVYQRALTGDPSEFIDELMLNASSITSQAN